EGEAALADAEARVPAAIKLGEQMKMDERSWFSIRNVKRQSAGGKSRVVVDVMAPVHFTVDLFAEGPTPDWALPLPEPIPGGPAGLHRFAFTLDGLPPGVSAEGAVIKLTATAGAKAIEVAARLD